MKKGRKIMLIISIILILIVAATIGIGTYFMNYALVPNQGGEDRQVQEEELLPNEQIIEDNRLMQEERREEWLAEVEAMTEEVFIESEDGLQLQGHTFIQENPSHQWAMIVHGYQSSEAEAFLIAPLFYEAGYNVLTMDLRAHGDSQGNYIGMGYLDSRDLLSWTEFLLEKDSDSQIVYHGTSMGAATVLMASGLELPSNVKVIIEDCGYSGVWDIFSSELDKRFNLPSFPVLDMARIMAYFQAGYDIKDGNVIAAVEKNDLPTLFIHGEDDDFVPVEMGYQLYEANASDVKDLLIIENAGHAEAKYANPELYYETIFSFIAEHMN